MQMRDSCAICLTTMVRKSLLRILPCGHLFHEHCFQPILNTQHEDARCPICRQDFMDTEKVEHKTYNDNRPEYRQRIVECSQKGGDWKQLAASLDIKYKTAYGWVRSGEVSGKQRGGYKRRYLNEVQIEQLLSFIEADPELTLKQLKDAVRRSYNINVSISCIGNYLDGQMYTIKKFHHRPVVMNSNHNKELRRNYLISLNEHIQGGKDVIWIDETNFNLFCRRLRGWSRKGTRAVQDRPSARGPNLHVIGAISCEGIVRISKHRGAFKAETCNAWIADLLVTWRNRGKDIRNLVIVCDNAPCHSRIATSLNNTGAQLLRLGPYSPPLNPIETVWSSLKSGVRRKLRIPEVTGRNVGEQRLVYLEAIVESAIDELDNRICVRAYQHSTSFHGDVMELRDLRVGE